MASTQLKPPSNSKDEIPLKEIDQPHSIFSHSLSEHLEDAASQTASSRNDILKAEGIPLTEGQQRRIKGVKWAALIVSLLSAHLLCSLDNTIVANIQAPIIRDLGQFDKFPWISVGFELGAASANLFWGHVNRLFDKKYAFLVCMFIFEIGSAICAAAPTLDALIVGRVICGFGGTGFVLSVMNIIAVLTTLSERAIYVSLAGSAWAIGAVIGPVVGGAINNSVAGWRWCFYLNVLAAALALPAVLFILPNLTSTSLTLPQKLGCLDLVGFALWTGMISCLICAISFGGVLFDWSDKEIIGLFIGGGFAAFLFVLHQAWAYRFTTSKEHRYFPAHFFKRLDMTILFVQMVSVSAVFFLSIYFLPLYFQFVQGDSTLWSGVRLLPFLLSGIFSLILNGALMGRTGLYMPWFVTGSALVVVGAAFIHLSGVETHQRTIYGYSVLLGIGIGTYSQAAMSVAQAKVPPKEVAMAVSFISCAQISGIMASFSVGYAVFLNTATKRIATFLPQASAAQIQAAFAGLGTELFSTLSPDKAFQVLQAVNDAIDDIWIQVLATGALSFALALLLKPERLVLKGSRTVKRGEP